MQNKLWRLCTFIGIGTKNKNLLQTVQNNDDFSEKKIAKSWNESMRVVVNLALNGVHKHLKKNNNNNTYRCIFYASYAFLVGSNKNLSVSQQDQCMSVLHI